MKAPMLLRQLAVGVGFSTMLVGSAMAAPIGFFNHTQEFEFVSPIAPASVVRSGQTAGQDEIVGGSTKLNWGTPAQGSAGPSSLVINALGGDSTTPSNTLVQGSITTSTDVNAVTFDLGPRLTHNNFVITGNSLQSATAQDHVVLSPLGLGNLPARSLTFGVNFEETPNNLTGAACPSGITNGSGCGDIFTLSGGFLGVPMIVNGGVVAFMIDSFVIGDYFYKVLITSPQLNVLSDAACSAAGTTNGCVGFVTHENATTSTQLSFAILATAVPEPATIALLSGSLLLMGLVSRRRKVNTLSA